MHSIATQLLRARLGALCCVVLLAACTPPDKPEEERRPEPRSASVQTAGAYTQRARAAQQAQAEATDRQGEAVEAATR